MSETVYGIWDIKWRKWITTTAGNPVISEDLTLVTEAMEDMIKHGASRKSMCVQEYY